MRIASTVTAILTFAITILAGTVSAAPPTPTPQLTPDHVLAAQQPKTKPPAPATKKPPPVPAPPADTGAQAPPPPPERLEIDVSTNTVAVTSAFSGTEIIVFGTVINSRQPSPEAGFYDVVVLVEGHGATSIVRLKSRVGGMWINTQSVRFDNLPLYSAIASSRPLDEIAEPHVLVANVIGFGRARMFPGKHSSNVSIQELDDYKSAAIRLKEKDGLYVRSEYGVIFIGPALFRATVKLPANIPVGPLDARVYLFHEGQLLAAQKASVRLTREGVDRLVYDFAFDHPILYGLLTVTIAILAGFLASVAFRK
ncbi:MAG: TIGR02186 family protein [Hyphomicrobiaceae bacterium]